MESSAQLPGRKTSKERNRVYLYLMLFQYICHRVANRDPLQSAFDDAVKEIVDTLVLLLMMMEWSIGYRIISYSTDNEFEDENSPLRYEI